ncbi:hypothetical protein CSKR_101277 [Clonorchis sinensis]|uniref:Uncharacterized protein n=1 Tax=Clonorchis sinensis TaxID=79923 RepID=A0A419PC09_CLOSI|nr:hypothetical protein CSKR_101277 [Clonorchis sinensis]
MERSDFNYSINMSDLQLERMALEHHHRNMAAMENDPEQLNDGREFLDRPFAGIAILAGFFLLITLILCILILIFYKKRNTVFVYEKSVHRGLTASLGDRSVVIGHASGARHLASQYAYNSEVGSTEDESTEDDSFEDWEIVKATAQSTFPSTPDYCPAHPTRAAYNIRPNDELIANFQVLRQQYPEGSICAEVQDNNPDRHFETMNDSGAMRRSVGRRRHQLQAQTKQLPLACEKHHFNMARPVNQAISIFHHSVSADHSAEAEAPQLASDIPTKQIPKKEPLSQAKQSEILPNK